MSALALRRPSSLILLLGLGVVGAVMALLVLSIAHTLKHVKPVHSSKPRVSAVVWGDKVLFGTPAMAHWLKVHGIAYSVWAERHPPANRLLKQRYAALLAAKHKKSR